MLEGLKVDIDKVRQELARRELLEFTEYTMPTFYGGDFHKAYYSILDLFAQRKIKKLIISCPPQHGKSEGSTRRLPSYMLGHFPNLKFAIASYSSTQAKKFGRDIKKIMLSPEYKDVFDTTILKMGDGETISNADEFEVVGDTGSVKLVGRGGALTGNPVDVGILDDLYKDRMEANSPVIREAAWDFFTDVFKSRLHNDSQELIVFTRWHPDDLIGRLQKKGEVIEYSDDLDLCDLPDDKYLMVNFEAIKTSKPTKLDPREKGTALWPQRHSIDLLEEKRRLNVENFNCLYQGKTVSIQGLLYSQGFKTYEEIPSNAHGAYAKCDSADSGTDYLCSIVYKEANDYYYVTDVVYTQEGAEKTEKYVSDQYNNNDVKKAYIESNAAGKAFGRNVKKMVKRTVIHQPYQSGNKEARIISNASTAMDRIIMPNDWHIRWPDFYDHVTNFKKLFKANAHDDAPDTLTMIVEKPKAQGGAKTHGSRHARSL